MNNIDPQRTQKLISSMRDAVSMLRNLSGKSQEVFMEDRHLQSSAKYNFIAAIEAAIDLANHIISKNRFRAPEDYSDTFRVLAEQDIIDGDFAQTLVRMARFRNRLVHIYWDIDTREVWKILQSHLDDFDRYERALAKFWEIE